MKRLTLLLLSLIAVGLAGCQCNKRLAEIPNFGESHFEQLDHNHDGTVVESELQNAASAPEFNESERELIKLIREQISDIGHVIKSEEYSVLLTPEKPGATPTTKMRYLYGIKQFEFNELAQNQRVLRTNMTILIVVYITFCLTISTSMYLAEKLKMSAANRDDAATENSKS